MKSKIEEYQKEKQANQECDAFYRLAKEIGAHMKKKKISRKIIKEAIVWARKQR